MPAQSLHDWIPSSLMEHPVVAPDTEQPIDTSMNVPGNAFVVDVLGSVPQPPTPTLGSVNQMLEDISESQMKKQALNKKKLKKIKRKYPKYDIGY